MSDHDQQPVSRTIGRRRQPEGLPDAAARAAWTQMAQYRTRAPKGIFLYDNHAQMEADRLKWTVEAMTEARK